jgi:hypothetical protein
VRLTAFNLRNIVMRKISIFLGIIGLLFAAYYVLSSGAESTERVVLLPRSVSPPALPDTQATTTNTIAPITIAAEASLAEQIKALETSGALPKLDRSTDIKGPDQNLNGVRDDIDAWIDALPITEIQRKAATQIAKSTQNALLVDTKDKAAMDAVGDESMAGIVCLKDTFEPNYQEGSKLSAKLEAMTVNTKERTIQYIKYNRAASGSVTSLPLGPLKHTCK